MTEHVVAVEQEAAGEPLTLEHPREPDDVIFPHFRIGDFIDWHPHGDGFFRFANFAETVAGSEDVDLDRVPVGEMEAQFAALVEASRSHTNLFLDLSNRTFVDCLAGFDAATRTIDLASAKAAFFANEENFVRPHDKAERGSLGGLPVTPVDL